MIIFHAHGFDTLDMKSIVKFAASRLDLFIVIKTKTKHFPFFSHTLASRAKRDTTYGIRAKLKCLDPMNSLTCKYVVNYVI